MTLLELRGLDARYGEEQVLYGVSLMVEEGELVAVRGAPGSGRRRSCARSAAPYARTATCSSTASASCRTRPSTSRGRASCTFRPTAARSHRSPSSTTCASARGSAAGRRRAISSRVFELFPELYDRRDERARSLSDESQELLAFARALMGHPRLVLVDEPSPAARTRLGDLQERGVAALVVTRDGPADHVLDAGRLVA